ncbi:hypothetical protein SJAV_23620 [Sulfurisphaera javensis]|uniref:Uncharacterized protein n=1 Tax=Sulfurisphaera javensis TaxID=2049879 RepID=A0AAT9GU17_9CREN
MKAVYLQITLLLISFSLFILKIPYPIELAIAIPTVIKMIKISRKIRVKRF